MRLGKLGGMIAIEENYQIHRQKLKNITNRPSSRPKSLVPDNSLKRLKLSCGNRIRQLKQRQIQRHNDVIIRKLTQILSRPLQAKNRLSFQKNNNRHIRRLEDDLVEKRRKTRSNQSSARSSFSKSKIEKENSKLVEKLISVKPTINSRRGLADSSSKSVRDRQKKVASNYIRRGLQKYVGKASVFKHMLGKL